MMTKEQLEEYRKMDEQFINECERVCIAYARMKPEFQHMESFALNGDMVECAGEENWQYGGHQDYTGEFPAEWLTFPHDELRAKVDQMIEDERRMKIPYLLRDYKPGNFVGIVIANSVIPAEREKYLEEVLGVAVHENNVELHKKLSKFGYNELRKNVVEDDDQTLVCRYDLAFDHGYFFNSGTEQKHKTGIVDGIYYCENVHEFINLSRFLIVDKRLYFMKPNK